MLKFLVNQNKTNSKVKLRQYTHEVLLLHLIRMGVLKHFF